jgi:DNA-binding transcriptional LysR family regulator
MLDVTRLRVIDAVARPGSVTAAARELHYSQPSVTHHLGRLEAETGAQLLQRVGRGIRLTEAGLLLADRAAEIIGRIDAADAELAAHIGLSAGRVRLAGFSSAVGSLVPRAVAALASRHPGLRISLTDTHPPESLELLRTGRIDVAIIFRYDETEPEPTGSACTTCSTIRCTCCRRAGPTLGGAARRDVDRRLRPVPQPPAVPVRRGGFEPRIGYISDDMVVMQALVAAGLGVTTIPGWPCAPTGIDGSRRPRVAGLAAARLRRDLRRAARPAGHRRPVDGSRRRGCRWSGVSTTGSLRLTAHPVGWWGEFAGVRAQPGP